MKRVLITGADGLIGLVGIVVPYMIPLVVLLVALEQAGIMHRVAFVVDRGFHHIGLHGGIAVPFLIGLGCNVPAISAAAATASGRDRVIAACQSLSSHPDASVREAASRAEMQARVGRAMHSEPSAP